MKPRAFVREAGLILAAVIALAGYGCGNKSGVSPFSALAINQRPTVEITSSVRIASSPADPKTPASYSMRIDWAGKASDGRVAYYTFAIDPGDRDTIWHATRSRDTTLTFVSKDRIPNTARSESPHTFVIKAYDDGGISSAPEFRSFFSNNIAPTVRILSPLPSDLLMRALTPTMTVTWDGSDPDGYLMGVAKPIYYRYKVFEQGNAQ